MVEYEAIGEPPQKPRAPVIGLVAVGTLSILGVIGGLRTAGLTGPRLQSTDKATERYTLVAHNEYTREHGFSGRGYPFVGEGALIEPYRETQLVSLDKSGAEVLESSTSGSSCSWVWSVEGPLLTSFSETVAAPCAAPVVTLQHLGSYTARLVAGSVTHERALVCRYVRRSLRKLSNADRVLYLDAFITIATTSATEGLRTYGSDFQELDYFNRVHLARAAGRQNDALHDGMGFLIQHISLTDEFERALQAVAPSVAVPYWDYTEDYSIAMAAAKSGGASAIASTPKNEDPEGGFPSFGDDDTEHLLYADDDAAAELVGGRNVGGQGAHPPEDSELVAAPPLPSSALWTARPNLVNDHSLTAEENNAGLAALWTTSVWSEEWFGSVSGAERTVQTGRFAYQRVTSDPTGTIHNSYGFLRSPWNSNKSPFVTRSHTFCGFSYNLDWWPSCAIHHNLTFDSAYDDWYDYAWASPYSPHGPVHFMIGGYDNCGDLLTDLDGVIPATAVARLALNMINVPKNMWRAHEFESPAFCSQDTPQTECHLQCTSNITDAFIADVFADMPTFGEWSESAAFDTARRRKVVEKLCTTPWSPGEQMESASPSDASFWPIHPTMDRLLQYRRILRPFNSSSWESTNGKDDPKGSKYCQYSKYGCDGHHPYDLTVSPTRTLDPTNASFVTTFLSNGDLYHMLNPHEYKMSFVYDAFDWAHCEQDGVKFTQLDWAANP